jgi:hypothetical protein
LPIRGGYSAIDRQIDAVDKRRVVARQEGNDGGDLLGRCESVVTGLRRSGFTGGWL